MMAGGCIAMATTLARLGAPAASAVASR